MHLCGDLAAVGRFAWADREAFACREVGPPASRIVVPDWGGRHESERPLAIGEGLERSKYRPQGRPQDEIESGGFGGGRKPPGISLQGPLCHSPWRALRRRASDRGPARRQAA